MGVNAGLFIGLSGQQVGNLAGHVPVDGPALVCAHCAHQVAKYSFKGVVAGSKVAHGNTLRGTRIFVNRWLVAQNQKHRL